MAMHDANEPRIVRTSWVKWLSFEDVSAYLNELDPTWSILRNKICYHPELGEIRFVRKFVRAGFEKLEKLEFAQTNNTVKQEREPIIKNRQFAEKCLFRFEIMEAMAIKGFGDELKELTSKFAKEEKFLREHGCDREFEKLVDIAKRVDASFSDMRNLVENCCEAVSDKIEELIVRIDILIKKVDGMISEEINEKDGEMNTVADLLSVIRHARAPQKEDFAVRCDIDFEEVSPLRYLGYTVGLTHGLSAEARREFLDDFYRAKLPLSIDASVRKAWGAPGSEQRLHKMKSHIKGMAELFRRNDPKKYAYAIRDWIDDYNYLAKKYG